MFPSRRATMGGSIDRDEWSIHFDGSGDYLDTGSDIIDSKGFAVVCWIKYNTQGTLDFIFGSEYGSNFLLNAVAGGGNNIAFRESSNLFYNFGSNATLLAGGWHHLVWTSGVFNQSVYIDNNLLGSIDTVTTTNAGGSTVLSDTTGVIRYLNGGYNDASNHWVDCNLSEVAIYNTTFTSQDVNEVYNDREPFNYREGLGSDARESLVGWWRMGDGTLDRKFGVHNGVISDESVVNGSGLGSELITNGDFTNWTGGGGGNPDNWTVSTESGVSQAVSQSSGQARMVCDNGNDIHLGQAILTIGKVYKYSINVTTITSGTIYLEMESGTDIKTALASGVNTGYFVADHATFRIRATAGVDVDVVFDDVSVKEVAGGYPAVTAGIARTDFKNDIPE